MVLATTRCHTGPCVWILCVSLCLRQEFSQSKICHSACLSMHNFLAVWACELDTLWTQQCLRVYYTHINTSTHICTHICTRVSKFVFVFVCTCFFCVWVYVFMCVSVYVCMCVSMHMYTLMHTSVIHIYMYTHIFVYLYLFLRACLWGRGGG